MAATWVNITDILWPVSSVYYTSLNSSEDNSPANLFGGTWEGPIAVTDSSGATVYRYIRTA